MKSFSFRLDRILKLREDAEQVHARRFGEAAREEADLDQQCRAQAKYLAEIGERIVPDAGKRTSAGVLQLLHLTSSVAAAQLDQAEQARHEAEQKAEALRVELAQARMERKTLERLKEQQQVTWHEGQSRDDRKEMDEIAARSKGRR